MRRSGGHHAPVGRSPNGAHYRLPGGGDGADVGARGEGRRRRTGTNLPGPRGIRAGLREKFPAAAQRGLIVAGRAAKPRVLAPWARTAASASMS